LNVIDARLQQLGFELPQVFHPVGKYLGCKRVGHLLYVGGHGLVTKSGVITGKVGASVDLAHAREAAKATALSMLATERC
jgi:hypothetical protein